MTALRPGGAALGFLRVGGRLFLLPLFLLVVPSTVTGYSILDAAPLGGAKSEEAESFVRKEEEEEPEPPAEQSLVSEEEKEKEQLLNDTLAVLAEQTYQLEVREFEQRQAEKAAHAAMPDEQKQKEAFELFDQDGSGAIDPDDLRAVMNAFGKKVMLHDIGDQLHQDVLDDLLSAADQDRDGQVTFKDYSGFLLEMAHHPNFASSMKLGHSVPLITILSEEF